MDRKECYRLTHPLSKISGYTPLLLSVSAENPSYASGCAASCLLTITEVYILCWRELSRRRLLPAVSPVAGHLTTPIIIDCQGRVEISAQRPPRLAEFNAR